MTDEWSARLASAEAAATKAISLAPQHAASHLILGRLQIFTNRTAQGIAECQRALTLDRNLADAYAVIGLAELIRGHPEQTETEVNEALRLSPRDHRANVWMHFVGAAKLHLGDDEGAVACFRRAIEINPNFSITHFYLAAALALLGRREEARFTVQTGLGLNPTFTIKRLRAGAASDNPIYLAQRERDYEGMRKAGLPEE